MSIGCRLLDSFDMCLVCHILYWYFVTNYGNLESLSNPVWYTSFAYVSEYLNLRSF